MLAANPWLFVILGVAVAAGMAGAYVKGRSDGRAVIIASQAREDQIRMETLQLAQLAAAEEIAKIEVKNVTIRQKLETEIREKPVYRDCAADQRVLDTVNEAITGSPAADSGELPAAGGDDRAHVRGLHF
jgi:hypothetical protein